MKSKIGTIIAVILLLLIASAVCSCKSTQYVPQKEVRIDTIRIVSHDTIKITQHSVPVSVPLPTVYLSNVTKDTVSILNSGLYKSVASIKDGSIHKGRPVSEEGAHCVGHNKYSIGVCYIGGLAADGKTPKDTRTDSQKSSLLNLLTQLKKSYPGVAIRGHRDFAAKACPSFDATKEYCNLYK